MTETMELAVVDAKNAIQIFTGGGLNAVLAADPAMIVEELDRALTDIARLHPDRDWEEFSSRASSAKKDAAQYIPAARTPYSARNGNDQRSGLHGGELLEGAAIR